MIRSALLPACVSLATSCSFYSYPERRMLVREGEQVAGYTLLSVEPRSVKLRGAPKEPITLRIGEDFSAGNNQHLELISTDLRQKQATFEYSSLEWHGGLSLPPF